VTSVKSASIAASAVRLLSHSREPSLT
jgi:hypothetical protein